MNRAAVCVLALMTGCLWARATEPLNMTIKGESKDNVDLETLSPSPDIPSPDALPFSLDGGKAAMEGELVPLTLAQAALLTPPAALPIPALSLIPAAPYIVHQLPSFLAGEEKYRSQKKSEPAPLMEWTFTVVDDRNREVYHLDGKGAPPNPITWNGELNGRFVLDPNRVYTSLVVLHSSGTETTLPGAAARFTAFARADSTSTTIELGERIYVPERAEFSDQGRLYLGDIARRIDALPVSTSTATPPWKVTLFEPATTRGRFGSLRQGLWKKELEKQLHRSINEDHIALAEDDTDMARVRVFIPAPLPSIEPALRGEARYASPALDDMAAMVRVRQVKDTLIIEMRHDRLFEPGTAYVRDEAMPYLTAAMREARKALSAAPPARKKVLLRSFIEKPRDDQRDALEEDPKLAATRSKVLFGLFARDGLITTEK